MAKETRTAPLSVRIKPSLKEEVERLAAEDKRTVSSYVEIILEAHVEALAAMGKRKK